jgi:ribosomal protein L7/L12
MSVSSDMALVNELVDIRARLVNILDRVDHALKSASMHDGTCWMVGHSDDLGGKVRAIKAVRNVMGIGLAESRRLIDSVPQEMPLIVKDSDVHRELERAGIVFEWRT